RDRRVRTHRRRRVSSATDRLWPGRSRAPRRDSCTRRTCRKWPACHWHAKQRRAGGSCPRRSRRRGRRPWHRTCPREQTPEEPGRGRALGELAQLRASLLLGRLVRIGAIAVEGDVGELRRRYEPGDELFGCYLG